MKKALMIVGVIAFVGAFLIWSTPAQAQLPPNDHYACYQSKGLKTDPKPSGTLFNQVQGGNFEKCKFKLLCVPTDKNGSGVPSDPTLHYCGWQCKGFKGEVPYFVTDQFNAGPITAKKLKFILNRCTKS